MPLLSRIRFISKRQSLVMGLLATLLILGATYHAAHCQEASNEVGRVAQFQAELKAEGAVYTHSTSLDMQRFKPIPTKCMDDMMRRADAVFHHNMARRRRSFTDSERPSVSGTDDLIAKLFRPPYPCSLEQRVGYGGDGGKWICRSTERMQGAPKGDLAVVSVGSGGLTDFEEDMNRVFGTTTDTFDPFMPTPTLNVVDKLPYIKIHTAGLLGTRELEDWRAGPQANDHYMVALSELLQTIEKERVDIFKIDCTSCEYGFSDDLAGVRSSSQVLGQILMKVHNFNNTERFMQLIFGLESVGYRMFHAETNAYTENVYEVAFIHDSQLQHREDTDQMELSPREDMACYSAFAQQADAIYNANWARKQKRYVERGYAEIPQHLKWPDVVAYFMMGDYPCQLAERFGVWGKGGASVCLRQKPSCPGIQKPGSDALIVTLGGPGSAAGSRDLLFEEELASAMNAKVHIFNPGLKTEQLYPRESDSRPAIEYHDRTVCGPELAEANSMECIGLKQMMNLIAAESIQVLRIDCKGCEFELVNEMEAMFFSDPSALSIGQIVLRASNHRLTQPVFRTLGLMGYRTFIVEESEKDFEVSMIHQTCL